MQLKKPDTLVDRMTAKQLSDMDDNTQTIRVLVSYSKTNFYYANGQA
jgi:hypothetical protein